jgi:epoxyqueuosine reductase
MKERIRQLAFELGFDDCRFTTANPPDHASAFQMWITGQRHGEMGWLERTAHKRVNPQEVLLEARTVISLAVSYERAKPASQVASGQESGSNMESVTPEAGRSHPSGVIARYAQFPDYHDLLGDRLKSLAGRVNQLGGEGIRSLWYVDTGPLLERDLAQRAGLGFVGKHTNLISRKLGNWIFLAEIITTLKLEPDESEKNRCGSCSRCITACPTSAITAPFQLDARKCISYLTIELKGSIPVELRAAIGNRIYGCDDCLAACPWNRFAREGQLMKQHARDDLAAPALLELLAFDDAAFKRRFAGTPLLRTKRRGLLRNVCVALGNVGNESALPALEKAALDSEPLIAEHARWAIDQIQSRITPRDQSSSTRPQ